MSLKIEEKCPKCGGDMYVYLSDVQKGSEIIVKVMCRICDYEHPELTFDLKNNLRGVNYGQM